MSPAEPNILGAAPSTGTPAMATSTSRPLRERAKDPVTDAIRARLQQLLRGTTPGKIAQATGHNHETIRRYLIGGILPADFIYAVCVAYSICPKYLLLGIGRPFADGAPGLTVQERAAYAAKQPRTSGPAPSTGGTNLKFHGLPPKSTPSRSRP